MDKWNKQGGSNRDNINKPRKKKRISESIIRPLKSLKESDSVSPKIVAQKQKLAEYGQFGDEVQFIIDPIVELTLPEIKVNDYEYILPSTAVNPIRLFEKLDPIRENKGENLRPRKVLDRYEIFAKFDEGNFTILLMPGQAYMARTGTNNERFDRSLVIVSEQPIVFEVNSFTQSGSGSASTVNVLRPSFNTGSEYAVIDSLYKWIGQSVGLITDITGQQSDPRLANISSVGATSLPPVNFTFNSNLYGLFGALGRQVDQICLAAIDTVIEFDGNTNNLAGIIQPYSVLLAGARIAVCSPRIKPPIEQGYRIILLSSILLSEIGNINSSYSTHSFGFEIAGFDKDNNFENLIRPIVYRRGFQLSSDPQDFRTKFPIRFLSDVNKIQVTDLRLFYALNTIEPNATDWKGLTPRINGQQYPNHTGMYWSFSYVEEIQEDIPNTNFSKFTGDCRFVFLSNEFEITKTSPKDSAYFRFLNYAGNNTYIGNGFTEIQTLVRNPSNLSVSFIPYQTRINRVDNPIYFVNFSPFCTTNQSIVDNVESSSDQTFSFLQERIRNRIDPLISNYNFYNLQKYGIEKKQVKIYDLTITELSPLKDIVINTGNNQRGAVISLGVGQTLGVGNSLGSSTVRTINSDFQISSTDSSTDIRGSFNSNLLVEIIPLSTITSPGSFPNSVKTLTTGVISNNINENRKSSYYDSNIALSGQLNILKIEGRPKYTSYERIASFSNPFWASELDELARRSESVGNSQETDTIVASENIVYRSEPNSPAFKLSSMPNTRLNICVANINQLVDVDVANLTCNVIIQHKYISELKSFTKYNNSGGLFGFPTFALSPRNSLVLQATSNCIEYRFIYTYKPTELFVYLQSANFTLIDSGKIYNCKVTQLQYESFQTNSPILDPTIYLSKLQRMVIDSSRTTPLQNSRRSVFSESTDGFESGSYDDVIKITGINYTILSEHTHEITDIVPVGKSLMIFPSIQYFDPKQIILCNSTSIEKQNGIQARLFKTTRTGAKVGNVENWVVNSDGKVELESLTSELIGEYNGVIDSAYYYPGDIQL